MTEMFDFQDGDGSVLAHRRTRSSMVELAPYKRPILVQLQAGVPFP